MLEEAKDNKMLSYEEVFLLHEHITLGRVRDATHSLARIRMALRPPRSTDKDISLSLSVCMCALFLCSYLVV